MQNKWNLHDEIKFCAVPVKFKFNGRFNYVAFETTDSVARVTVI